MLLKKVQKLLSILLLVLLVSACGTKPVPVTEDDPVETLYNKAVSALEEKKFVDAIKYFDEVERLYPYSQWSPRAQLMAGYTYYKGLKYDEAIIAVERFIRLHPGHEDVAYAYYLKALSYYERIIDVERDQKVTEQALNALQTVVRRFPDSTYARDAQLKIDLVNDHLGGKEMEIGRFYQKRKLYLAAINRYKLVIEKYQTTTHAPEALHRLAESYLALGLNDEAKKMAAVLGYNYPGSEWYTDSYRLFVEGDVVPQQQENEKSWYEDVIDVF